MATKKDMNALLDVTKAGIRQKIWDHLERTNIAEFPRPVHHRIPNFKGAAAACDRVVAMDVFRGAMTVKVNPDKPQEQARFRTLESHKTLLVPTPRLQRGLFNRIVPPVGGGKDMLRTCASSQGVRQYSSPVGLDAKVKIDLIIIGSVAVSPKGWRIGKGEGYADMEYAMMATMGAVTPETLVVSTVHDCQVLDEIPDHLFGSHDLTVDYIVTPTRMIKCEEKPKPTGIIWSLLTAEKLSLIPVLKILRDIERNAGKDVRLKDELECSQMAAESFLSEMPAEHVTSTSSAMRSDTAVSKNSRETNSNEVSLQTCSEGRNKHQKTENKKRQKSFSLYVGNIPHSCTIDYMRSCLEGRDIIPDKIVWKGQKGHAFLQFFEESHMNKAMDSIAGLVIDGRLLRCEVSTAKSK